MKNIDIIKKKEGDNWFKRNFKLYSQDIKDINITNLIKINSIEPKSILEIGCANGMKLNQYQDEFKSKINYGIDLSKKSINHGKKKYKKLKLLKLSSLEIEKIKINFDLIICGSFLYLLDRELIFKQFDLIFKKLNKNGYLIIQGFDPLFKHTNKNIHSKNLKSFKMSYDNFLEESGLFKMIYKKKNNSKLIKSYDNKKFKSDDWSLTLFKKIDFEESYPENI
ncbi:methyltransferase domain-containing protein [Candidatus Pelagibacter sp.]|nr:methyltransferase domain-containing protein [Candidatus Pelagibacter sp.]